LSLLEVYIYIYIYSEREREMCCKCSKYVRKSEKEREEGVVRCHCLIYTYIYIYTAREREMSCKCSKYVIERARGSERRGVVILKCLDCIERERAAL